MSVTYLTGPQTAAHAQHNSYAHPAFPQWIITATSASLTTPNVNAPTVITCFFEPSIGAGYLEPNVNQEGAI